jgi:hypothetical protein
MKLPPFTLVHDPDPDAERRNDDMAAEWLGHVRGEKPAVAESLTKLPAPVRRALLNSTFGIFPVEGKTAIESLSRIVTELERQLDVVRVGIWDLDAHVGALPRMIEALNASQPAFTFFEVQASIPAGLVSAPAKVVRWASENAVISGKDRREMRDNVIADDFYRHAERVMVDLSLDYLIGLTPKMVAGEDDDEIFWNHFSSFQKRLILASVYELPRFANEAGRPYEALVGGLVVAQLLVAIDYPALGFHDNRGCLFDYNEDRVSIVRVAKRPRIEANCLKKIRTVYRAAAVSLIDALRAYTEGTRE